MTDKEFLLELSSAFNKAECSEPGIIKVTKELSEVIASRVKEIAEKM